MERCNTCKHWNTGNNYALGSIFGLGVCEAVPMFWDSTEWKGNGEGRRWTAKAENKTAFVQDGSDYRAALYTKSEHGCTMHDPLTVGIA